MKGWPWTAPEDLRQAMEAAGHDGWEAPVQAWAKRHGLKLKIQWFADLQRRLVTLDEYRDPPSIQTRWVSTKEWLEVHDSRHLTGCRRGRRWRGQISATDGLTLLTWMNLLRFLNNPMPKSP